MTCSTAGLSATWTMQWGNLEWLKRSFEEYNFRGLDFLLDNSGKSAIVSLAIGDIALHSQEPKMMMHEAREELNNIFQSIQMQINISEDKGSASRSQAQVMDNGLARNEKTAGSIVRTYPKLLFSFSSDLPMENWLKLFNQFPALEIVGLEYAPDSNTWTYKGQILCLKFLS